MHHYDMNQTGDKYRMLQPTLHGPPYDPIHSEYTPMPQSSNGEHRGAYVAGGHSTLASGCSGGQLTQASLESWHLGEVVRPGRVDQAKKKAYSA